MEVPGMNEVKKPGKHIPLASSFMDGGFQDACDDSCSICLDDFCDSDPPTVTTCKHEFHLHCILEWCQRSSNCPMCWQNISLKDPSSQELLLTIEQERRYRSIPPRNEAIFQNPSFGDFELQHFSAGMNDSGLEDRIIQHLVAAAAMRRPRHIIRRDGSGSLLASLASRGAEHESAAATVINPSPPLISPSNQTDQIPVSSGGSPVMSAAFQGTTNDNSFASESSSPNNDRAGPSDFQSFSDTWRSRLSSISMRYKESISRNAIGWKEKLFSRSPSMADIGSEVRREISAGIATVSNMMERLEIRDNNRAGRVPEPNNVVESSVLGQRNHNNRETQYETPSNVSNTTTSTS